MADYTLADLVHAVVCPGCGSARTLAIGAIPPGNAFAGRLLERERDGGCLWRCLDCHLLFRHPRPDETELNLLYQSGHADSWATPEEKRTDWRLIREWLHAQSGVKRVLDVGCFDGRLLEFLGHDYEWLGIEIHEAAAARARARGVKIIGKDFTGLPALHTGADVVLAVDVIEHGLDPKSFLVGLAACARPGGYVVVSTGNTGAAAWRLMGGRYWYCHIAEHMSFINPDWARCVAPMLGLEVINVRKFSHADGRVSFLQRVYEIAGNLVLRFAPSLFAILRRAGMGGIDLRRYPGLVFAPPYWMGARDHMLVVFRRCV